MYTIYKTGFSLKKKHTELLSFVNTTDFVLVDN